MSQVLVYPRFFTTVQVEGSGVVVSKGDSSINTLMALRNSSQVNTSTWKFRQRVLEQAQRLFGDFSQWLSHQRNNHSVAGWSQQFVEDTVQFILTGRRRMSVLNWIELLDEMDADTPPPAVTVPNRIVPYSAETVQTLQAWCSHPDGIEDLLQTLFVLFGHARHATNPSS